MKWVARNCWRLWNVSNHCSLNSSFGLWGRVNVGRKMWWQNNDLQNAWKNSTQYMCDIFTKCTECCKIIEHPRNKKNKGGKKHQCGVTQCPVCQEDVDIRTHKFFIQPAEEEERLDALKKNKNEMLASNDYSVKASPCQQWTLMN